MATYAIGDVQGCWRPLERLLARVGFDPGRDRAWFAGDLVNRGPASLDVVRFVRDLGPSAVAVMGNHELYAIARAASDRPRSGDTLDSLRAAPDRDELLAWLRQRPLLHREAGHVLVHAALHPAWSLDEAEAIARDVEARLQGPDGPRMARRRGKALPTHWAPDQPDDVRALAALTIFTRVRVLRPDGRFDLSFKGRLAGVPAGRVPWWRLPRAHPSPDTILFGHWAALGHRTEPGIVALDSGCVWGGALTAWRLDDGVAFQEPCRRS